MRPSQQLTGNMLDKLANGNYQHVVHRAWLHAFINRQGAPMTMLSRRPASAHSMSDTQYRVLMDLYHEYNEAFRALPQHIQSAYYARLYAK